MAEDKPETYGKLRPWQRARVWVDRVTTRKATVASWVLAVALVLCGLAAAGLALHWYYLAVREAFGVARDASLFGDAFGAFSALASALGTIGVVAALLLQQKQLTLQREELRLQRDEMRAARREHRKAAEAQAESARAARAQAAAFAAESIDRFLVQGRTLLFKFRDVAEHLRSDSSVDVYDAIPSNEHLPPVPVFCPDADVVNMAKRIQAEFLGVTNNLRTAATLRVLPFDPANKQHQKLRRLRIDEAQRTATHCASDMLPALSDMLADLERHAADWFLKVQDPEPVQSGERPVTTSEEQAS